MQVLGYSKPLIGVVHLLPLPGAPRSRGSLDPVIQRAIGDARLLLRGGCDGLIVENFGDAPFFAQRVPPETVAALTAVALEIRHLGEFPLGINVLRCDAEAALAVATVTGAQFVRVNVLAGTMLTDQGLVTGRAAELLRLRRALRSPVAIWADLAVKHAQALAPVDPVDAACDLVERAGADALIVTGPRTGRAADAKLLAQLRRALPRVPWIVGSGIAPANLAGFWQAGDAFIVGSALRRRGQATQPVDRERVRRLAQARRSLARA